MISGAWPVGVATALLFNQLFQEMSLGDETVDVYANMTVGNATASSIHSIGFILLG